MTEITKLRDDSFNLSRGWVLCLFVTQPVSVVLFTQITNYLLITITNY